MANSIKLPLGTEMEEKSKKVFHASNKFMKAWLQCPDKKQNCFECGNAECFEAMGAMADSYGITFDEFVQSVKKQRAEAVKAVEIQKKRFEEYAGMKKVIRIKKTDRISTVSKPGSEKSLFDMAA